jgi:hypothetical protein
MPRRIAALAALAMLATHGCGARSGLELFEEDAAAPSADGGLPPVDASTPTDVSVVDTGADVPTIDAPVIDAPVIDAGSPIVCEWSRVFGIRADLLGLAVDPLGNVVISGRYQNGIDFGSGPAPPALTHVNGFIAKLDPNGATLWSHIIGGDLLQNVRSVGVDDAGNVYALVLTNTTLDLGLGAITGYKSVLAKYDPAGNLLWNTPLGIGNNAALAVGHDGTSFVVHRGQADGGPPDTSTTLFISIDASGNKTWERWFDGLSVDLDYYEPELVTLDPTGRAVVVARYTGAPDLGGGPLPTADAGTVVFGLDSSGNHTFSTPVFQYSRPSISVAPNGETVVAGKVVTSQEMVGLQRLAPTGVLLDTKFFDCHVLSLDVTAESGNIVLGIPMEEACDFGGARYPRSRLSRMKSRFSSSGLAAIS